MPITGAAIKNRSLIVSLCILTVLSQSPVQITSFGFAPFEYIGGGVAGTSAIATTQSTVPSIAQPHNRRRNCRRIVRPQPDSAKSGSVSAPKNVPLRDCPSAVIQCQTTPGMRPFRIVPPNSKTL